MKTDDEIKLGIDCLQKFRKLREPLSDAARKHGYALTYHGSLTRDIDLVAIPWTNEAAHVDVLIDALIETIRAHNSAVGFVVDHPSADPFDEIGRNPSRKPHGRLAWSIHLGGGPYVDLSIIPPS